MDQTERVEPGLADDIVEASTYEATRPASAKTEFQAWHRPRKQYVRQYQWVEQITSLLRQHPRNDGTIKYIGLPGIDLLDLRHLHNSLCKNDLKLRFLGFDHAAGQKNSPAQSELNISLDEVKRLKNVDPLSHVIGDDFAMLSNDTSLAHESAMTNGPYDVVNLDLCDSFGANPPDQIKNTYYTAVNNLLAIQARNATPWMFFLTTRSNRAQIDAQTLNVLIQKFTDNIEQHASFATTSQKLIQLGTTEAVQAAINTEIGLFPVFLTGLCKWFVARGLAQTPSVKVEVTSVVAYRVAPKAEVEDLVSIAFKFTPMSNPPADTMGLAAQPSAPLDEATLATAALRSVVNRVDADKILANDANLTQEMTAAIKSLLESARYDISKFDEWVAL